MRNNQGRQQISLVIWVTLAALFAVGCGGGGEARNANSPAAPADSASSGKTATATVSSAPGFPGDSLGLDGNFWQTWGDGQAELSSYRLTFPRYGALRPGTAVAIFVTENLSLGSRVKTDSLPGPGSDAFPVMKLNLVEDFQTGIYDYNVMTSVFISLNPVDGSRAGTPAKISMSAQDWCGHVFQQLLFRQHAVSSTLHSYFEGEGDAQSDLSSPRDGVSEDVLLLWARGMAEPRLAPGESRSVPFLASLKGRRFAHRPLGWSGATLSRGAETQTVTVPAGEFEVEVFRTKVQGGPTRAYYVERTAPHRVVKWESSEGEVAELVKSIRAKYWEMNDPGSVENLAELSLPLSGSGQR